MHSTILAFGLLVGLTAAAQAHDAKSIAHPSNMKAQVTSMRGIANLTSDERTRSVLVNANKWPAGSSITVCFEPSSSDLRHRIRDAALTWFTDKDQKLAGQVELTVDFGTEPNLRDCSDTRKPNGYRDDIRIGFDDAGYWSYIGLDSHLSDVEPGKSMNFENFNVFPPADPDFSRIVKHEFGHAFGFHHEHQSPGHSCYGEINIDAAKQLLGWDDAAIQTNFGVLAADSRVYTWSAFDPKSIMMYSLPAALFKDPALSLRSHCFVPQDNNVLSVQDGNAIKAAYPTSVAARGYVARGFTGPLDNRALSHPYIKTLLDIRSKLSVSH